MNVLANQSGRSPLHYAVVDDDAREVVALLTAGADPDAQDVEGFTPLHFAAQEGALAAAQAFSTGARLSIQRTYTGTRCSS